MAKITYDPIEKKLLHQSFMRNFLGMASTNVAKQNGHAYCHVLLPWLKYLYGEDTQEFKDAMVRHNIFYNSNHTTGCFIFGLGIAMEKERARTLDSDNPMDGSLINNMKVSLQGPMAGIGDTLMFNTVRVIAAGVSIPLLMQGSVMGVFLFCLIQYGVQIFLRHRLFYTGYNVGLPFIEKVVSGGIITSVTNAASVLGLTMVGSMVVALVRFPLRLNVPIGDEGFALNAQEILDSIMPNMIPLALLIVTVMLLRKKHKVPHIIFYYIGACVLLAIVGIV